VVVEAVHSRIAGDRRPGRFLKKSGRRCRIGAVVFVAGGEAAYKGAAPR
jgi:hypothetical protein